MAPEQLENLARSGSLQPEAPARAEFDGLVRSGTHRLDDASNRDLSPESRFDLAYNAAHALALAALRWHGFRPSNRYLVFQCLQHNVDLPPEQWRVLDQAHRTRNLAEYEGVVDTDTTLIEAMLRVAREVEARVRRLVSPPEGWE